jgi:predicted esterase
MSGYLPRPEEFKPSAAALDTPTLFCHGTSDDVVKLEWAKLSEQRVRSSGVKSVDFKIYERMGHSAVPSEIRDVLRFLQTIIPDN